MTRPGASWPPPAPTPTGPPATLPFLLRAAFEAHPDDEEAGLLATDLLNSFAPDLTARDRAALDLLLYTDRLGTPAEGTEWVRHLAEHATAAAPLPDALRTRAERALAHRLLAGEADDIAELSDLARSGDAALLAAYAEVAAEDATARRLRTDPAYAAACFRDWSSHPGATPAWDETRLSLLTTVLRPVVRTLPHGGSAPDRTPAGLPPQHPRRGVPRGQPGPPDPPHPWPDDPRPPPRYPVVATAFQEAGTAKPPGCDREI